MIGPVLMVVGVFAFLAFCHWTNRLERERMMGLIEADCRARDKNRQPHSRTAERRESDSRKGSSAVKSLCLLFCAVIALMWRRGEQAPMDESPDYLRESGLI